MNKRDCKIVQDLLPNYVDNLTQKETNDFLEDHLKNCEECSKKLDAMKAEIKTEKNINNKKEVDYMKKIRKKLGALKIIGTSILSLIVLIIIFIVGNYLHVRNVGKIDKTEKMTEEEIISLLEKGRENKNYYLEQISLNRFKEENESFYNDAQTIYFAKDGVILSISNSAGKMYYNYNTNENITYINPSSTEEYKYAFITTVPNYPIGLEAVSNNNDYSYKYIGKQEINGKKYVVANLLINDEKANLFDKILYKLFSTRVFINADTGIIEKEDAFYIDRFVFEKFTIYYNVKLNCITDEDVEKPSLSGYVVRNMEREN